MTPEERATAPCLTALDQVHLSDKQHQPPEKVKPLVMDELTRKIYSGSDAQVAQTVSDMSALQQSLRTADQANRSR